MTDYLNDKQLDSELIIGLVCAVGSETNLVIDLLKERLGCAGYEVHVVKVSRDCGGPGLTDSWRDIFTPLLPGRFRLRMRWEKGSPTSHGSARNCKTSRCT